MYDQVWKQGKHRLVSILDDNGFFTVKDGKAYADNRSNVTEASDGCNSDSSDGIRGSIGGSPTEDDTVEDSCQLNLKVMRRGLLLTGRIRIQPSESRTRQHIEPLDHSSTA